MIKNKQQSRLAKKYNKLVKLHHSALDKLFKERSKLTSGNYDKNSFPVICATIRIHSEDLKNIGENLKTLKWRIKCANKEYQTTHY